MAPQSRDIAMVFQSYALYPHMTVYDNLAFGLRNHKIPKKEIDTRVRRAAEILDLDPLIKRKPKQLSGGQRQRVALGRAIVREPAAFLMDEPLSNLDAKLRVQTRAEILKLQENLGTTTIYVTHDQVEAMTMGDRIAVMNAGVLQQVGRPEELYTNPANVFVAGFIGSPAMNLVPATVIDGAGGADRIAGFRPEHIDVVDGRPDGYVFDATVGVVEYLGDEQLAHMTRKDTPLQAKLPVEEKLSIGEERRFVIPRDKLLLFDAETGERARGLEPAEQRDELLRVLHDDVRAIAECFGPLVRRDRDSHRDLESVERLEAVEVGGVVAGEERAAGCRRCCEQPPDRGSLVRLDRRDDLQHLAPEPRHEARGPRTLGDLLELRARRCFVRQVAVVERRRQPLVLESRPLDRAQEVAQPRRPTPGRPARPRAHGSRRT